MSMIDMTAALSNPYTLDSFTVSRREETTNGLGEVVLTVTTLGPFQGVVYPEGSNAIDRMSHEAIAEKTLVVICKFALRGLSVDGSADYYQPDLVIWHGNNYLVKVVDDYSQAASGFIKATCSLQDQLGLAPITEFVNGEIYA